MTASKTPASTTSPRVRPGSATPAPAAGSGRTPPAQSGWDDGPPPAARPATTDWKGSAFANLRASVVMMALFTVVLGLGYPLAITALGGVIFPSQAAGSLIRDAGGRVIGSTLIAQAFVQPGYLHPRPSAAGNGYDPMNSGGSNLGPMDQKLIDRVKGDAAAIRKDNPDAVIPPDAVTTSGSGLDPDISPANAHMQVRRIAKARGATASEILAVIDNQIQWPVLGFIGQPRVNVLATNRVLDHSYPLPATKPAAAPTGPRA